MVSSAGTWDELIGRGEELRRLDELWSAGERLVTLLGPGGRGKTRLALEAARRLHETQVVVCRLDGVDGLEELVARVAEALGLASGAAGGPRAKVERVGRALTRGAPLLVLDGCERAVAHAPATVRRWLELAPELRCLVTSRRALGLEEELRLEVPALPDADGVRLLLAQARRLRADWGQGERELALCREIVRHLDGLPLAIKLCAGRAAMLAPAEMLRRLDRRFELLAAGRDDRVSGHRSLQAALDGSWELLAADERRALAWVAVFRGGFAVEAAEAVLGGVRALDRLQALRDHSLLVARPPGADGVVRLALEESVRDYALERLDELGERAAAERRAAAYFTAGAEACLGASGAALVAARARLAAERDDVVVAVARLLGDEPARAVDLLLALQGELLGHERRDRHLELLATAVAWARAAGDRPRLAGALAARAEVQLLRGRLHEAEAHAEEAGGIAEAAGAAAARVDALRVRGEAARAAGDVTRAGGWLEEAFARARAAGDRRREAACLMALASLRYVQRRFEPVERAAAEAGAVWAELGEPALEAQALAARGVVALERDRLDDARTLLEDAGARYRQAGHRVGEGRVTGVLGEIAWARGNDAEARRLLLRAVELHQAQDAHPWLEMELAVLALVDVGGGRAADALAWARQAEHAMGGGEYVRIRVLVQTARALAEAAHGALAAAEAALSAARTAARSLEPVIRRHVELCDGFLDVARATAARAAGDDAGAEAARAAALAQLAALDHDADATGSGSHDLRAIARLVRAALAGLGAREAPLVVVAAEGSAAGALRVDAAGRWFSPPGGGRVTVDRRPWGRVLAALVRQRAERPGVGLSSDELFAAGWPDERALPHAARNRVWVALSGLRTLGLEPMLRRTRGAYLLDPAVLVHVEG